MLGVDESSGLKLVWSTVDALVILLTGVLAARCEHVVLRVGE